MKADLQEDWCGKKVAVIGLGVSNLALIQVLQQAGATLSGRDRKTRAELGERARELEALGIELILGPEYLDNLESFDIVMVSPGVPKHLPELQAVKHKGKLSSEIALVFKYSPAPIYGVSGSSGKTTTTSLIGEMLKNSGISVHVGGNIGNPLIAKLEEIDPQDSLLLELSSFQLDGLGQSPQGALLTNLTENHLDLHLTTENYIQAKQNIYCHQKPQDFLVLNYDDPITRAMAEDARGRVYYFSLQEPVRPGAYLAGDDLIYQDEVGKVVFAQRKELVLPGEHNVANFLAAAVFSHLIGASWEAIRQVGEKFTGVPHRLELVRELDGVRYYNDSIATTPHRTQAALHSFSAPIILIAGGSDKNLSFAELGLAIHTRVKRLILLGVTAPRIRDAVLTNGDFPIDVVQDLGEAVTLGRELASSGDVVLLSPACASYDQYPNFVARGNHFRDLVQNLAD